MKLTRIVFIVSFIVTLSRITAVTIITTSHSDWSDPAAWSSGQVPVAPDTIIIRHYITFSANLIIQEPTVVMIDSIGTLCGDYLLDVSCGAKLFNYGEMYVNHAIVRDMWNYRKFWSKNYVTIQACALIGSGNGFSNVPPNGSTWVWPEVPCKTENTNWYGEAIGIREFKKEEGICVYPNPVSDKCFLYAEEKITAVKIKDACGRVVHEVKVIGTNNLEFSLTALDPGFYVVEIYQQKKSLTYKIIKQK